LCFADVEWTHRIWGGRETPKRTEERREGEKREREKRRKRRPVCFAFSEEGERERREGEVMEKEEKKESEQRKEKFRCHYLFPDVF
jgi:hypothetical protein